MAVSRNVLASLSLVLFLSLAVSYREIGTREISKRYALREDRHTFQDAGKCDRKFFKKFNKVMMGSNCMPRPTIVDLIPDSPEILLVPSKVVVNRCGGECHARLSCMSTNSMMMAVEVEQLNIFDEMSGVKCGIINLEMHTRCDCECRVMKHHCNSKQLYMPKECMCLCTNDEERNSCNLMSGDKFWNSNTCRCECHTERECTTGLIWVPERCSCAKLMPEENNFIEDNS